MSEVLGAEGLLYPTFGTLDGSAQGGDAQIALCSMTFAAVRAGNHKALQQLLSGGAMPDGARDSDGNTPLLLAAKCGHSDCVKMLLDAGADLSNVNFRGEGILHLCFANGFTSLGVSILSLEKAVTGGLQSTWTACAEEHGVDTEALIAAMELGLDLTILDGNVSHSHEQSRVELDLSSSTRFPGPITSGHRDVRHHREYPRPPNVPGLQFTHQGDESEIECSNMRKGPQIVPELQLPVHDLCLSSGERELMLSAIDARQAEAAIYEAAALGHVQQNGSSQVKADVHKKKREKIRSKHRHDEAADNRIADRAINQRVHVSESIILMGKAQAAFESEQMKIFRAQQDAANLDREIQDQLDQALLSAASQGDAQGIKSWLEKGASVDATNAETGQSALHLAAATGRKKACKALLREGAELDALNFEGESAAVVANRNGHTELEEYLLSKSEAPHGIQIGVGGDTEGENACNLANSVDNMDMDVSVAASVDVSLGTVNKISCKSRSVLGDIHGMMSQLSSWQQKTYPQGMERDCTLDVQDLEDSILQEEMNQIDADGYEDDDDEQEHDILKCAEELLQSVSPAYGKEAMYDSGLDMLLEEAMRIVEDKGPEEGGAEQKEFDATEYLAGVLENTPIPRTRLQKIVTDGDRDEVFRRRGLELKQIWKSRSNEARPRIVSGVALVIANMCSPQEDGLSTYEQFTCDLMQLEKTLPFIGFEYVDVKQNLTRQEVTDCIFETASALCPGGNLEDADGFLLIVLSTGGPTGFDAKPMPGANSVAHGACTVAFQEIVNLVKVIPNKMKAVLFNICGDPVERKRANFDVPLIQTPCVPSLYQEMLNDCKDVLLVLSVTSGRVHWVPKAGSLLMRFLLEEINGEGLNKDLAELIVGTRTRLLEYFFARRGTGKPQCPVGRSEYEKFFIQTPIYTDGSSKRQLMLGPGMRFAKSLLGADFLAQEGFLLTKMDTCVIKDKATKQYVHAYSMLIPRTCEGLMIENGNPNLAWQLVLHEIDGSEEIYVGAVVPPQPMFRRAPSLKEKSVAISRMSSAVDAFQKVSSSGSNTSGTHKIRRVGSLQRAGSGQESATKSFQRVTSGGSIRRAGSSASTSGEVLGRVPSEAGSTSFQRAPSFGRVGSNASEAASVLDLNTVAVVGKADDSWSVSADGRVHPDPEGHGKFSGLRAGSVIQMWHNRSTREFEIIVDGHHVQKVWKKESLGQLIVPAVSIGPSTTCTIELTNFWSWENPPPQMDTEDIQKSISPQDTKKEDIFAIIQNISGIAQD